MHLLVTNDDGIDSVLLHELVRALGAAGHRLSVVAPAREQRSEEHTSELQSH